MININFDSIPGDMRNVQFVGGPNLYFYPVNGLHTTTVAVVSHCGARNEYDKVNDKFYTGGAHLLEHMLFKGTKTFASAKEISNAFSRLGAYDNAFTGWDNTSYYIDVPFYNVVEAGEILLDMYCNARFALNDFEDERKVVLQEIRQRGDDGLYKARAKLRQIMFAGQKRLDGMIAGDYESVEKLKQKDLLEFYRKYYGGNNTDIFVVGRIDEDTRKRFAFMVVSFFSRHFQSDTDQTGGYTYKTNDKTEIFYDQTESANFWMRSVTTDTSFITDQHKRTALLLACKAYGGGSNSRLYENVREKNGLSYQLGANVQIQSNYAAIGTAVIGHPDKINAIIDQVHESMKIADDLTDDELDRAKNNFIGDLMRSFDNPQNYMRYISGIIVAGKTPYDPKAGLEAVNTITLDEVKDVLKMMFNSSASCAVLPREKTDEKAN